MSEGVTVQGNTSRRATTNPWDEGIKIHIRVLVGRCGQERASLDPNGRLRVEMHDCSR